MTYLKKTVNAVDLVQKPQKKNPGQ